MQNTSGTQYGSLEARHSTNPNSAGHGFICGWKSQHLVNRKVVFSHASEQWRGFVDTCFGVTKLSHGRTLFSRSCPATVARRNATHTSGAVGHVDSLCVLLNVSNSFCHPLSIRNIGLVCIAYVRLTWQAGGSCSDFDSLWGCGSCALVCTEEKHHLWSVFQAVWHVMLCLMHVRKWQWVK